MKILITGGAGFIGSHLCEELVNKGHTVICLDNFSNGNLSNIRHLLGSSASALKFKLVFGDIRDRNLVDQVIGSGPEVVVHLAAQIHVDRSVVEPGKTFEINALGTLNVLEAARRFDVGRVVYFSSSEVYGSAKFVPMNEDHPLAAPHPYGASKIAADRLCHSYVDTYGMNIDVLRPFNTFGPRQKGQGYGAAISIFVRRVLAGYPPLIYGDGLQTRDYMYIDDLVRAVDLVLKSDVRLEGPVNLGTGREVSITDLAWMIIKLCGGENKIEPVHVAPRPGEVRRLVADSSKARRILGWQAEIGLEQGLKRFIEWHKSYRLEEWEAPG